MTATLLRMPPLCHTSASRDVTGARPAVDPTTPSSRVQPCQTRGGPGEGRGVEGGRAAGRNVSGLRGVSGFRSGATAGPTAPVRGNPMTTTTSPDRTTTGAHQTSMQTVTGAVAQGSSAPGASAQASSTPSGRGGPEARPPRAGRGWRDGTRSLIRTHGRVLAITLIAL